MKDIFDDLALPVIAAPMFKVSGPELVIAACRSGVIGAFPAANAGDGDGLRQWLRTIEAGLVGAERPAPVCPNVIMRDPRSSEHLSVLADCPPRLLITSVGSPAPAIKALEGTGAKVFADVASLEQARKAAGAGADGLVLLSAGAGGNSGWLNPFAFVRAVRDFFGGPLVLAGGMSDGAAIAAARFLGCDLVYVGTRFIAARESMAAEGYRQMLCDSSMDDIITTKAFTGLDANILRPSIAAAGLDPNALGPAPTPEEARKAYGAATTGPRRWSDIWSAGHSVSGVERVEPVDQIVATLRKEYRAALAEAGHIAGR